MAETIILNASARAAVGRGVGALRRSGQVPGIVYGRVIAPVCIQFGDRELAATLRAAGRNRLITLSIAGEPPVQKMVLTREIQRDPIKGAIKHVDLYEVSLTEKVNADVAVECAGESPDMKSGLGVLLQEMNTVSIRCLPTQLFEKVTVDVSGMQIDDTIYVRDLQMPEGIEVMDAPGDVVARLTRFVEEKVEEAAAEAAEVEVIEKGKKEEEGAEEGEKKA